MSRAETYGAETYGFRTFPFFWECFIITVSLFWEDSLFSGSVITKKGKVRKP
jgi:hypothetical protein